MVFRALRTFEIQGRLETRLTDVSLDDLSPGEVVVRVTYSSLNYKDALAVTGRGRILRRLPLNPGIDLAGVVEASTDARFARGAPVLAHGMGLGETHDGGFAACARVPVEWLLPMPDGLSDFHAMALGTAGFTAALSLFRLELNGQTPAHGAMVVTGATGGVGSIAVRLLAARGYDVTAVSGRPEHARWLTSLGASRVVTPEALALGSKPLERVRFGGVIDNVGGRLLGQLLPHVAEWGNVVSVGLAGGATFEATVYPFILRGVNLLGASSANCPMPLRADLWRRLGSDLRVRIDDLVTEVVGLDDVVARATALLDRRLHGRVVVKL